MIHLAHLQHQSADLSPTLVPITKDNQTLLDQFVRLSRKADPFSRSSAYYRMTGRRGLWLYGTDDTAAIIAAHPNRDGELLMFPPLGKNALSLIEAALSDHCLPPGQLRLARLGPNDDDLVHGLFRAGFPPPHAETVLDWTYPVHVISPAKILEHTGKAFASFRGHINRALHNGLYAEPIDIRQHRADIAQIACLWAKQKQIDGFTYEDLVSPTFAVLELMANENLPLGGILTRERNGNPVGFWLWERVDQAAMSLVRCTLRRAGNAELGILATCVELEAAGVTELCLGGSETAHLDAFKRKMQPIRSITLLTMDLPANLSGQLILKAS